MEYTVNTLDKFDVALLQQLKLSCLMPIMVKRQHDDTVLHYKEEDYFPLSDWQSFNDQNVLTILHALIKTVDELNQYLLLENKLMLSLNSIFIKGDTVKWCYCPDIIQPSKLDVSPLLKNLLLCESLKLETVQLLPLYQWLSRPVYCDELSVFLQNMHKQPIDCHNIEKQKDNRSPYYTEQVYCDSEQPFKQQKHELTNQKTIRQVVQTVLNRLKALFKGNTRNQDTLMSNFSEIFEETTLLMPNISQNNDSIIIDVRTKKEVVLLDNKDFIIGSFEHNDFGCFQSDGISRRHIKIIKTTQGYVLNDLNSKNGTFVNGKKVENRRFVLLEHGDEIVAGSKVFRFLVKSCDRENFTK